MSASQEVGDPDHATMRWVFKGRTDLDTVARQRRVTVWGDGVTTFRAFKTLTFDRTGFVGRPATSFARSDNWPRCISAPPLVKSMAWRRLRQQRCEGNQIVARHAEPLINHQLDADAGTIIASANDAYCREFRDPLVRGGAFLRQMDFSTSHRDLRVVILQAADDQSGAPQPAPGFDLAHDIGIRMHETAVNNLAESLLAGHTLTDEEVRTNVAKLLTMASLDKFTPNDEERPWSITFAQQNPVTVKFNDGAYTLVIAGQRWKSGLRSYGSKLNVTVTYRIEMSNDSVQLVRDEDVLIAPPGFVRGKGRLAPATLSLRRILQRKFDELFPAIINPEKIVVPGPWEKAGPLSIVRMVADSGWLQVSWKMQPAPDYDTLAETDLVSSMANSP